MVTKKPQILENLFKKPIKDKGVNMPKFQNYEQNNTQQSDLLFLPEDDGYKYALVVVDIATRLCDAAPLKNKLAKTVLDGFKIIYSRNILKMPKRMEVDDGTEFKGIVAKYFKDNNVYLRVAKPGRHRQQAIVERKNQSIGTLLFKRQLAQELLTGDDSVEWVEDLPKIIEQLNEKAKKIKQLTKNQIIALEPLCEGSTCNLLAIGTKVRTAYENPHDLFGRKLHGKFRSTDIRWNPKERTITNIGIRPGYPPLYELDNDNSVKYTKNQLQVIPKNEQYPDPSYIRGKPATFIIEKILSKKKIKGKWYLEIKWKSYKDSTMEPYKTIKEDQPEMVEQFEQELKAKNKK